MDLTALPVEGRRWPQASASLNDGSQLKSKRDDAGDSSGPERRCLPIKSSTTSLRPEQEPHSPSMVRLQLQDGQTLNPSPALLWPYPKCSVDHAGWTRSQKTDQEAHVGSHRPFHGAEMRPSQPGERNQPPASSEARDIKLPLTSKLS